jgi:hypothetical protein
VGKQRAHSPNDASWGDVVELRGQHRRTAAGGCMVISRMISFLTGALKLS